MINELHEAMRAGRGREVMSEILQGLVDYTKYHFSTEERYMALHGYPEYQHHRSEHKIFVDKVMEFQRELDSGSLLLSLDVMDFLKNWLSNHILVKDKKYAPFFNERGLR